MTPAGFTLLLGGARSGKSDLATKLAASWHETVTVIVTAEVAAGDLDFAARVARHRADRPRGWRTIEAPHDLPGAVASADASLPVVVDCVSVWIANLFAGGLDEDGAGVVADALADALSGRSAPSVVVSNEVGMGVHPSTPAGRAYRDVLGRANRRLADRSTAALLVVAGRVLPLREVGDVWP